MEQCTIKFDGSYYPWKELKNGKYGLAAGTTNEWIDEEVIIRIDNDGNGEASTRVKFKKPTADLKEHLNKLSYYVVDVQGKVAPAD